MNGITLFLKELDREAVATRKVLGALPESKFDWQPNPNMNTNKVLASRIIEMPGWIALVLTTNEVDLAEMNKEPNNATTQMELMERFESALAKARAALVPENEAGLRKSWMLRNGDTPFSTNTKGEAVRHAINQMIHHRALLSANLRLLDITVPEIYGTAAGDPGF